MKLGFWWAGLFTFVSIAIADVAWTRYNLAVSQRIPARAANWSVVIILLGAVSFFTYVDDRRMVIFAALGAYVGTYWAVRHGKS